MGEDEAQDEVIPVYGGWLVRVDGRTPDEMERIAQRLRAAPSNERTVFDYDTGIPYCPVCHAPLPRGWHLHRRRSLGLVTRSWWYEPAGTRVNVRAWKLGTWLFYHRWEHDAVERMV